MHTVVAPEIFWLAASAVLTGVFWAPYVLNRIFEHGLWAALRNPNPDDAPKAAWARRMMAAHDNAVENLAVYAPLALAAVVSGHTSAVTAAAAATYFFARLAHVVIYTAGIPVLRTLAFAVGWGACVALALAVFGLV